MSNLETIRLGDLLAEQPAYGANASALQPNGIDPRYLRITDIDDQGRLLHCEIRCIPSLVARNYILQDGDIVIARTGNTVGKSYLHKSQNGLLAFAGYLIRFRIDKAKGDPFFVFHFLHSSVYWTWIQNTLRTGAQPNINSLEYKNLTIPKLPLPQQRKIAKILTTVDNLIEKTEALIAKYQSIKQGMMHDLFTRGVDTKGKLRPPQSVDMNDDLKLKDWRTVRLSEVTVKIADRDHYTPTYTTEGVIIVSPKDFDENGQIDFSNCQFVSETEHLRNRRKTDIKASDLIFTRIGARLGKACLVTPKMPEFSLLHSAVMIRVALEHLDPLYFLYVLKGQEIQGQIVKEIQSIGVPDLGLDKINAFRISIPPLPQQRKIAEILSKHDQLIEDHQNELLKYKNLKTALMQDLLTGKVQVTPDEIDKELAHA